MQSRSRWRSRPAPVAKIQGLTHSQLDEREEKFVDLVRTALETVASTIARRLGRGGVRAAAEPVPVASVDDLGSTRSEWMQQVDRSLVPYVSDVYLESGLAVATGVRDALPAGSDFIVPPVRDEIAEAYLANRHNFLVGISNDLWTEMREGLLDGFKEGESIQQLRNRVQQSAGFTMGRAEAVTRTEVVGASNAGAIDQVRATGLPSTKEWLATKDARTRPTHRRVLGSEGQTAIPLDAKFMVGGWPMDRPHDPNAPAEEVVRCRCTLVFDIDTGNPPEALRLPMTAAADNDAGAMIALIPSDADLDRLALPDSIEGAESRDVLHLTLWFLGEGADYDTQMREELVNFVKSRVGDIGLVHGRGFGINFWNPDGDSPSWVLAVGDADGDGPSAGESLSNVRDILSPRRVASPDENPMPAQHSPWVPHVCLAYSSDPGLASELVDRVGDITFDKVRVVFAGDETDVPLRGA